MEKISRPGVSTRAAHRTVHRRGFSILELTAVFVCLGILTIIGTTTINSLRNKTHDRSKQASAANLVSSALAAAQSEQRRYPADEDLVASAAELGGDRTYKAIRDVDVPQVGWVAGVDFGPSLNPFTLSYAFSSNVTTDRMMGVAIRSQSGNCVMGRSKGTSSLDTWVVEQDLGTGCAGRFALAGEQPTPTYPSTPIEEYGAPQPPTGLAQQAATSSTITMRWTLSPSVDVEFYRLTRDGVVVSETIPATSTTFTDSGLLPSTTYQYRISAVDTSKMASTENGPAQGLTAPAAPKNLGAVPAQSPSRVDVRWDSVPSATGYRLFVNSTQVYDGPLTTFTHSGVADATFYSYTVAAYSASGTSDQSPVVRALTFPGAVPSPSAVRTGDSAATVSWGRHQGEITGYRLFKGSSSSLLLEVGSETLSYLDTAIPPATDVRYWIEAYNATGAGPKTAFNATTAPATPTLEFVSATTSSITVRWVEVPTATSYQIRRNGMVAAVVAAGTPGATAAHTSTALASATNYSFQIQACSAAGCSPNSTPIVNPTVPAAPTGLTSLAGTEAISLSWLRPSGGPVLTGYRVYRGAEPPLTTTLLNSSLTSLAQGTTYSLRVAAFNASGQSDSAPLSVSTFSVPGAPVVSCGTVSSGTIPVLWNQVASTPTAPIAGYRVYRNAAYLAQLPNGTGTHTSTGLVNGTPYTFQVSAYVATGIGSGEGPPSAPIVCTAVAPPSAPTGVVLTPSNLAGSVSFTPSADNGGAPITSYTSTIYRASDNSVIATASSVGSPASAAIPAAAIGPSGTPAYARVVAFNGLTGAQSVASANATLFTVPDAPAAPSATASALSVSSSATAPNNRGAAITRYQFALSNGTVLEAASPSVSFTGLNPGTAYTVTVRAENAAGWSAWSPASPSATTASLPGTPTGLSGSADFVTSTVSWTRPSDGGMALSGQQVEIWADGAASAASSQAVSGTATSASFAGLQRGTRYNFRVRAQNAGGWGPWAPLAPAGTTTPIDPTGFTAVDQSTSVMRLSWNASPLATSYVVYAHDCGWCWTTSATSFDIPSRSAGANYGYAVAALVSGNPTQSGNPYLEARTRPAVPPYRAQWTSSTAYGAGWWQVSNANNYWIQVMREGSAAIIADGWVGDTNQWGTDWGVDGTRYQYRIRANGLDGKLSDWSAWSVFSPYTRPAPPVAGGQWLCGNTFEYCVWWYQPAATDNYGVYRARLDRTGWEYLGLNNNGPSSHYDNNDSNGVGASNGSGSAGYRNLYDVYSCNAAGCSRAPASFDVYFQRPGMSGGATWWTAQYMTDPDNDWDLKTFTCGYCSGMNWKSASGHGNLEFDWGAGSIFGPGRPDRWTMNIRYGFVAPAYGQYCFRWWSDDGHQVWSPEWQHSGSEYRDYSPTIKAWNVYSLWGRWPQVGERCMERVMQPGESVAYWFSFMEHVGNASFKVEWRRFSGPYADNTYRIVTAAELF